MNFIRKKKVCPETKILNPNTNRCIKINSQISKNLLLSNNNQLKTSSNELKKKSSYTFANRVSANINDRKKYYNLLLDYFDYDKNNNNYCIRFYKYNSKKEPIYRVGDKLILKKKIGSPSKNAIVYLSSFRDKDKKNFKFAIKINLLKGDKILNKEAITLSLLSKAVLNNKCPHFPILYAILKCFNFMDFNKSPYLASNSNTQNSLKKTNSIDLNIFPDFIKFNRNYKMLVYLIELANGDLKNFIKEHYQDTSLMENALAQIYFSIMFFHKETNMMHNDAHWGNFLFHKIKPGGYFHYKIFNEDYYIENLGYLWIIYDFDYNINFNDIYLIEEDFRRIIRAFISKRDYNAYVSGWADSLYDKKFSDNINIIYKYLFSSLIEMEYSPLRMNNLITRILYILAKCDFIKTKKTIKKTDIINNIEPYYINLYK